MSMTEPLVLKLNVKGHKRREHFQNNIGEIPAPLKLMRRSIQDLEMHLFTSPDEHNFKTDYMN